MPFDGFDHFDCSPTKTITEKKQDPTQEEIDIQKECEQNMKRIRILEEKYILFPLFKKKLYNGELSF